MSDGTLSSITQSRKSLPDVLGSEQKVKIIIPTYNYAPYLAEAIDSALSPTFPAVEVLGIDEGSTDDTLGVIARDGDRIRSIRQPNAGLSAARSRRCRFDHPTVDAPFRDRAPWDSFTTIGLQH